MNRLESVTTLDTDVLFRTLADPHRRAILSYLQTTQVHVGVRELVEHLTSQTFETQIARADRRAIEISLLHSHLPKLVDAGMVTYNRSTGMISRTPLAAEADPHLRLVGEHDEGNLKI